MIRVFLVLFVFSSASWAQQRESCFIAIGFGDNPVDVPIRPSGESVIEALWNSETQILDGSTFDPRGILGRYELRETEALANRWTSFTEREVRGLLPYNLEFVWRKRKISDSPMSALRVLLSHQTTDGIEAPRWFYGAREVGDFRDPYDLNPRSFLLITDQRLPDGADGVLKGLWIEVQIVGKNSDALIMRVADTPLYGRDPQFLFSGLYRRLP